MRRSWGATTCNSTRSRCGAQTRNSQRPSPMTCAPSEIFKEKALAELSALRAKRVLRVTLLVHQEDGAERRKGERQRPAAAMQADRHRVHATHVSLPASAIEHRVAVQHLRPPPR